MSAEIHFTIRSANGEEALRAKWIEAGILNDEDGWQFTAPYDVEITATQGWSGFIDGVPGWHANAIARGHTAEAMIEGLPQRDANGDLLPLMQRTWAAYVFGLVETQQIDPSSGFPFQATTADGNIQYGDPADIESPSNVRQ